MKKREIMYRRFSSWVMKRFLGTRTDTIAKIMGVSRFTVNEDIKTMERIFEDNPELLAEIVQNSPLLAVAHFVLLEYLHSPEVSKENKAKMSLEIIRVLGKQSRIAKTEEKIYKVMWGKETGEKEEDAVKQWTRIR